MDELTKPTFWNKSKCLKERDVYIQHLRIRLDHLIEVIEKQEEVLKRYHKVCMQTFESMVEGTA